MGPDGLTVLAPILQNLKALASLDMSCNNIALINDQETAELLADTLASLPQLRRLNLSNNRIRHKVATILGKVQQPLTHLELSACGLSDQDLQYLSRSHHCRHIQDLDISENNLGRQFESFCALLSATEGISVLETEDCFIDELQFSNLVNVNLQQLQHLRYWNASRNVAPRNADFLLEDMKAVIRMKFLETIVLSYPVDIVVSDSEDAQEKRAYEMMLHASLNKLCSQANRTSLKVVLVN